MYLEVATFKPERLSFVMASVGSFSGVMLEMKFQKTLWKDSGGNTYLQIIKTVYLCSWVI